MGAENCKLTTLILATWVFCDYQILAKIKASANLNDTLPLVTKIVVWADEYILHIG